MKRTAVLGILVAILVTFITTILVVCVRPAQEKAEAKVDDPTPDPDRPLDTTYRNTTFDLLNRSINFQASTCLTCLFHQEKPGGLFGDYEVYHEVIKNSTSVKFPHLNTPPSKVQMYMEQTKVHYPSVVNQSFWLMVNLEYLEIQLSKKSPAVSMVFVKTRKQTELLANYRRREKLQFGMMLTGHTSNDTLISSYTQDYTKFIHLAGMSPLKNTRVVVETWLHHPEWPTLTVVTSLNKFKDLYEKSQNVRNIDFRLERLPWEERLRLQNTHGIHVCPSEAEGFGHYINEARALKAVVITSNAAPMNELVTEMKNGILIGKPRVKTRGHAKAQLAHVKQIDIEKGVEKILDMSIEQRKEMGEHGRELFLKERADFQNFLRIFDSAICNSTDSSKLELLRPYLY